MSFGLTASSVGMNPSQKVLICRGFVVGGKRLATRPCPALSVRMRHRTLTNGKGGGGVFQLSRAVNSFASPVVDHPDKRFLCLRFLALARWVALRYRLPSGAISSHPQWQRRDGAFSREFSSPWGIPPVSVSVPVRASSAPTVATLLARSATLVARDELSALSPVPSAQTRTSPLGW